MIFIANFCWACNKPISPLKLLVWFLSFHRSTRACGYIIMRSAVFMQRYFIVLTGHFAVYLVIFIKLPYNSPGDIGRDSCNFLSQLSHNHSDCVGSNGCKNCLRFNSISISRTQSPLVRLYQQVTKKVDMFSYFKAFRTFRDTNYDEVVFRCSWWF